MTEPSKTPPGTPVRQVTVVPDVEHTYKSSAGGIIRALRSLGAKPDEVEDALNQAFVATLPHWREVTNHPAYLKRAAVNYFAQQRMRGKRVQPTGDTEPLRPGVPDERLTAYERREETRRFLNKFPPARREVIALLMDDYSIREIAQILGIDEAAVRQRKAAAKRQAQRENFATRMADSADETTSGEEPR